MIQIEEIVLQYDPAQLDAWVNGDKSLIPPGMDMPDNVKNQQSYHFGEYFVLRHYMDRGWKGVVEYYVGEWENPTKRYLRGQEILKEIFSAQALEYIREIRRECASGEPDVLLYKDTGERLFLEVKKGSDRVSGAQLECLAQFKHFLNAEVGVVYLKRRGQTYSPKRYELDTERFTGRLI